MLKHLKKLVFITLSKNSVECVNWVRHAKQKPIVYKSWKNPGKKYYNPLWRFIWPVRIVQTKRKMCDSTRWRFLCKLSTVDIIAVQIFLHFEIKYLNSRVRYSSFCCYFVFVQVFDFWESHDRIGFEFIIYDNDNFIIKKVFFLRVCAWWYWWMSTLMRLPPCS